MTDSSIIKDSLEKNVEINLVKFLQIVWDQKVSLILITLIFACFSIFYSLSIENTYRSSATLIVNSKSFKNNNQPRSETFGSMINLGLGANNTSELRIAIKTLQSRDFFEHLISIDKVLPDVIAAIGYDEENRNVIYDKKIYDAENNIWTKGYLPSVTDAYLKYQEITEFSVIDGFLNIETNHVSPIFAKDFVDLIIYELNNITRFNDIKISQQHIDYLNLRSSETNQSNILNSLNNLIEDELRNQTLAQLNTDYWLKTLESPYISKYAFKPNRAVICITITTFGFLIALIFILVKNSLIKPSELKRFKYK